MPKISERGIEMPESPIRKLAPLASAATERGIKVYHLNIGQPDLPTPQVGLDALKHVDRTILEYSPSQGYRNYREKLVGYYKKYNINVDADDIIITSGGSEAVLFAFLSCLNPGDEIIVPEPAYANYMAFAISAGAQIRTITTTIDEGFCLPKVEKFEELINDRTRAIMICNPNNPTGYLYTRREMNQIRDLVKKYDLYLFSDEVYREYIYTGSPYISACHLEGIQQNVILIDSVSKRYSECGIRVGALITKNEEVRKAVMKFCQARLSPPLIGQIIAEASLDAPEEYYRNVYDEYVERRKCLIDGLNLIPGVYSPIPMGAFYTVAKLPVDDSEKFCRWCLEEFNYEGETVMMAPASGFYTTQGIGYNEVRLAYVLKKEDLERALFILKKALEAYPCRVND
ncbi:MAG: pyridoxal phosphate-dependent aminotransferase [Phocaeicola sp.]|uniref:pyridoxal phosphate-dependent aminotransferase n=1 Tax=Phocaeicola TaxID=909656 RepID=UPI00234E5FDC|nr:pyridoxal phosphate-dependent aminotransferase [Phocaeicola oris]MCE2615868.1 pyridoxal phosphate-dependent aminotransferase [Phocaeicola oris]